MTEQTRDDRGRFVANAGVNSMFRDRAALRVGVAHAEHHVAMNDRLRAGRSLSSDDDLGTVVPIDVVVEDAPRPQVDSLDGGAGRGRSIDLLTPSQRMSDALREASGRLPSDWG